MFMFHSDFLCVLARFRRWVTDLARSFSWSTSRGPDGILPGATEVHLTTVARVIVAESRRNWFYFPGYQFRKNWSRRFFFFLVTLHPRPLCTLRRVAWNDPGRVGRTATSTGSTLGRSVKITFCENCVP